jgi:coenzyme PQQ precursor peptide PqqA
MLSAPARGQVHEIHEAVFMNTSLLRRPDCAQHSLAAAMVLLYTPLPPPLSTTRRNSMTWQTPTAIDWRFGFEISLYVSNR